MLEGRVRQHIHSVRAKQVREHVHYFCVHNFGALLKGLHWFCARWRCRKMPVSFP